MTPIWRQHLICLASMISVILALYARDATAMAVIWWTSSTFTHCLFILPLVGWLVWQRRSELQHLTPRLWAPGFIVTLIAAFAWMLGEAAGVSIIRHASLILMIQSCVLTLLGPSVARGLMFPLFYLYFLVPFGEELVPPMQTLTAKLCMVFLGWAGIPAHIEGVFITTPSGYFEVAEACAGVKFLVAMLAYGTLVANVCFRSWRRRIGFMALVVVVPILANGIRAYGTIHISALTSNKFAEGFDHVVYGWFFFAFVMGLVMAIGWKFFDRGVDDPWLGSRRDLLLVAPPVAVSSRPTPAPALSRGWQAQLGLLILALLPLAWNYAQMSFGRTPMPNRIDLPAVAGWQRVPSQTSFWAPRFDNADHRLQGDYVNAAGQRVTLAIALYAWQADGKEIVGYAQGAADPDSHWSWTNDTPAPPEGRAERIFAPGLVREVASFYVAGGMTTGRAQMVKLATLTSRLFGRDQAAVAILVSAEEGRDRPSRPAIDAFLAALGPPARLADALVGTARGQ